MKKSKIEFRQRRDLGEVISATIQFIAENFLHLNGHLLMLVAPFLLIGLMINKLMPSDWLLLLDSAPESILSYLLFALGLFFLFYVMLVAVLYAYLMLYERKGAKNFNADELFQKSLKIIPNVLGTFFWLIFFTFLGAVAMGLLFGLISVSFGVGGVLVSVLLFLLLMLPVIYLMVHLFFVFVIRLEEGVGFIKSVQRSFILVKGYFWETLGVLFVCSLIQAAISYAVMIPLSALGFMGSLFEVGGSSDTFSQALIIYYGISFGINVFTSIIPILAISLQYYNLIERKESKGLVAQIETIGTNKDASLDEEQY